MQEKQWNAKEKCVIYNNIHNKDIDTIIDLTSTKEIWDRLQLMYEEASNNDVEKWKRKRKEEETRQREIVQLNETSTCVNELDSLEEKENENQARLDLSLAST